MKHPGEFLEKYLFDSHMSQKELAIRTGVTEKHISTVISGDRNISSSFAKKLGYVFESFDYWIGLQNKYDEEQLAIQFRNNITDEELSVLKHLNEIISHFIFKQYMHNNCSDVEKVLQLRDLLNVSDLSVIPQITYSAAYRAQVSGNISVNPYVLFAWQRLCELSTDNIIVEPMLNVDLLKSKVEDIKHLMFENIEDGIQQLQDILSECGIAFAVVKNFRGAPVQGFIKKKINGNIILCLTIRRQRADTFWFTLFHEIAHIINGDYNNRFVDFNSTHDSLVERKADKFARNVLIDPVKYEEFIESAIDFSWDEIVEFSEKIKVKPFVVLGRLQNDGFLDYSDYSNKITKYVWA